MGSERADRVLITGGSGFIGTNLIDHYLARGATVLNVDVAPPKRPEHSPHWRRVDLLDAEALRQAIREFVPTQVLHMAARTDLLGEGLADYGANIKGVANLIGALSGVYSVERVVFASSRMVCRIGYTPLSDTDYCPSTVYGASKVEGERIVREADLSAHWMIVRPTSIWGPWFDIPYKDFFLSVARGRYFHVGHQRVLKSFGFVGNTVHQLERLLAAPVGAIDRQTVYLADYPPLEVSAWADEIRRQLGTPPLRRLPHPLLKGAALVGDGLKRLGWDNVPLSSFRLANLLTEMVYDLQPLHELVGELPFSTREGITETISWLRQQGQI